MLSSRTRAEMEAGARQVLKNAGGEDELPPGHMEVCLNTHARHAQLKAWEKQGILKIVRYYDSKKLHHVEHTAVELGDETFIDRDAEQNGTWPNELMFARIALAVAAGQTNRKDR